MRRRREKGISLGVNVRYNLKMIDVIATHMKELLTKVDPKQAQRFSDDFGALYKEFTDDTE